MRPSLLVLRCFLSQLLALTLCLLTVGCFSFGKKERAATEQKPLAPEVALEVSPERRIDNRPYEFIWSDRRESHEPLVNFEGLLGWTVEVSDGAEAKLERTADLQLWGRYVGRLSFTAPTNAPATMVVKPPHPMPIRQFFDSIQLWVHGAGLAGEGYGGPQLAVRLQDERGNTVSLPLGAIDWSDWWLVHRKVALAVSDALAGQVSFAGLELSNCVAPTGTRIYFDSLAFYGERMAPLETPVLPKRPLQLAPGQKQGLNTGTNTLAFPVASSTIVPSTHIEHPAAVVNQLSDYVFELTHEHGADQLVYTFNALEGLDSLTASWKGVPLGRLLEEAQCAGDFPKEDEVIAVQGNGHRVRVEYASGIRLGLSLYRNALVIDVVCLGGMLRELSLGHVSDASLLDTLRMPYLSWGDDRPPRIAVLEAGEETVFASVLLDWYRSNGSAFFGPPAQPLKPGQINGGVRYQPTTVGRLNDCYERLVVRVSPEIEQVLPVNPNPKGRQARALTDRLWVSSSEEKYEQEQLRLAQHHQLGLEHVVYCGDKHAWQSAKESFSLRTRAAPQRGGDATLSWFLGTLANYGWTRGLHANYCAISPLNQHWNADELQRLESGEWRRASVRNYALKASRSIAWLDELAPVIVEKFNTDTVYIDAHTGLPPWQNTDFDARIPGAGTFAQSYYCYGQLLQDASKHYGGPVIGAGGNQWMYAGLADGHLADPARAGVEAFAPVVPLFYLHQINPFEVGIGMGTIEAFFHAVPHWIDKPDRMIDQYLAAEIAYGHAGRVVDDSYGWPLVARSYYMLQQVQQHYLMQAPKRVAYRDAGELVDTSEALKRGLHEDAQLYINYPSDLEVWVNSSDERDWRVRVGRDTWTLPPYGWVAQAPDFFELSAIVDDRRIDYVESASYTYFDGRGSLAPFRGLASSTPIVLRYAYEERNIQLEVIDIAGTGRFAVSRPDRAGEGEVQCTAYGVSGKNLGEVQIVEEGGLLWVNGLEHAERYVLQLGMLRE